MNDCRSSGRDQQLAVLSTLLNYKNQSSSPPKTITPHHPSIPALTAQIQENFTILNRLKTTTTLPQYFDDCCCLLGKGANCIVFCLISIFFELVWNFVLIFFAKSCRMYWKTYCFYLNFFCQNLLDLIILILIKLLWLAAKQEHRISFFFTSYMRPNASKILVVFRFIYYSM